jgi:hypothetical protein
MLYRLLADGVLVVHFGFVLFVALGGLLAWRWPRLAWLHLPAVAWGALIEFASWRCPLTPLETALRRRGGEEGYTGGFIEHYITAVLYPSGLTRTAQIALGTAALLVNALVYGLLWRRYRRARRPV